jgi:dATP pyrophosphohydrolase
MYKVPISVLVVIHTPDMQILLLQRADHPGYWQSVTGSRNQDETLLQTAVREVAEETGLDATEHVFALLLPEPVSISVAAREHLNYVWLPWREAAEKVFSPSNAEAIRKLAADRSGGRG